MKRLVLNPSTTQRYKRTEARGTLDCNGAKAEQLINQSSLFPDQHVQKCIKIAVNSNSCTRKSRSSKRSLNM